MTFRFSGRKSSPTGTLEHSRRVEIGDQIVSLELEIDYRLTPGTPGVRHADPADCVAPTGPEVEVVEARLCNAWLVWDESFRGPHPRQIAEEFAAAAARLSRVGSPQARRDYERAVLESLQ